MTIEQYEHRYDLDIHDTYNKNYINLHAQYQHHHVIILCSVADVKLSLLTVSD